MREAALRDDTMSDRDDLIRTAIGRLLSEKTGAAVNIDERVHCRALGADRCRAGRKPAGPAPGNGRSPRHDRHSRCLEQPQAPSFGEIVKVWRGSSGLGAPPRPYTHKRSTSENGKRRPSNGLTTGGHQNALPLPLRCDVVPSIKHEKSGCNSTMMLDTAGAALLGSFSA